jgi:hypothetical protein
MIIFPQGFILSAAAAGETLENPRIGYQTFTRDSESVIVTASGEDTVLGPKEATLNPDTASFWRPPSLPAWIKYDFGSAKNIDYAGIAGHNFGDCDTAVEVRWSEVDDFDSYVSFPGSASNYASTPDSTANSIVGDLDLRAHVAMDDWTPATNNRTILSKWTESGNQRSYALAVQVTDGRLVFSWSADGTAVLSAVSTASPTVVDGGKLWIRATIDVDNGAAGRDVKFWTSTDYNPDTGEGTWNQLGSTVTTGGVTSIFNGTAPLAVNGHNVGAAFNFPGKVYYAEVRNMIGGAIAAKMRPDDGLDGASSWTSATGEIWTVNKSGSPASALVVKKLAYGINAGTNAPLMFLDVLRNVRFIKVLLTGTVPPKVGVVYAGRSLAMARPPLVGMPPPTMSRETMLHNSMSRGGQFLGQGIRRTGIRSRIDFPPLPQDWYRSTFDPFAVSAQQYPYFLAWSPAAYPSEVVYAWTDEDIRPRYVESFRLGVGWEFKGYGNG